MGSNANPKGILAQSPGLRGTSYPGKTWPDGRQPQRGCGFGRSWPTQPRWGCSALLPWSQGCSFLATLGWRAQSLQDWAKSIARMRLLVGPLGEGEDSERLRTIHSSVTIPARETWVPCTWIGRLERRSPTRRFPNPTCFAPDRRSVLQFDGSRRPKTSGSWLLGQRERVGGPIL